MLKAPVAAMLALAAAAAEAACVVPGSQLLDNGATCAKLASATNGASVVGLAGETESFQVLLGWTGDVTGLAYSVSDPALAAGLAVRQHGFVLCGAASEGGSAAGWVADPLLPLFASNATRSTVALHANATAPLVLWVDVAVPAAAANATLTFTADGHDAVAVAVQAAPWNLPALPSRQAIQQNFKQIWSFVDGRLDQVYHYKSDAERDASYAQYHDLMSAALLPPDALYKHLPYANFSTYEYLYKTSGAALLNMGNIGVACTPVLNSSQVAAIFEKVAPAVEKVLAAGWATQPYLYGFDEQPQACEQNIRALFGEAKRRWGSKVLTVSALNPQVNWKTFPEDLPVDVLVHHYHQEFSQAFRAKWLAAGKQIFFYHSVAQSHAEQMNTFTERPRMDGRELYWYAVSQNVTGWLYYATNDWASGAAVTPIERLANTSLTSFPPLHVIHDNLRVNGGGELVYPGPAGAPVGSSRLAMQRDAAEDLVLVAHAMAKDARRTRSVLLATVSASDLHVTDVVQFERARAELAAIAMG